MTVNPKPRYIIRDLHTATAALQKVWEKLDADHWGPTSDNKHLLVVIDKLSRYPEMEYSRELAQMPISKPLTASLSGTDSVTPIKNNGPSFNGIGSCSTLNGPD